MSHIDKKYFETTCRGTNIDTETFLRLADVASIVIESIISTDVPDEESDSYKAFQKAIAYEVECLQKQGGIDATVGFADGVFAGSESLGSYSVSSSSSADKSARIAMVNGVPVSPIAIQILKNNGLMVSWAYARRHKNIICRH